MTRTTTPGQPGGPRSRAALTRPRLLLLLALLASVAAFYVLPVALNRASRSESRNRAVENIRQVLAEPRPDRDSLGDCITQLLMLEGASTDPLLLQLRAEVEIARDRPDEAYRLFGAIGESPTAAVKQREVLARIQIARQERFNGGDAASREMLRQALRCSEAAYAESGDVEDVFRAWQASRRLWDRPRAKEFAEQLAAQHAGSREHRLVEIYDTLDQNSDAVAVEDLLIDFGANVPAELAALRTTMLFFSKDLPAALAQSREDLNRFAGVGRVRFVLAAVLQAHVLSFPVGSLDRAGYVEQRDAQLDWLLARAPESEPQRQRWTAMRAVR